MGEGEGGCWVVAPLCDISFSPLQERADLLCWRDGFLRSLFSATFFCSYVFTPQGGSIEQAHLGG